MNAPVVANALEARLAADTKINATTAAFIASKAPRMAVRVRKRDQRGERTATRMNDGRKIASVHNIPPAIPAAGEWPAHLENRM